MKSDPTPLQFLVTCLFVLALAFVMWNGNRDMLHAAYAVGSQESATTLGEVLELVDSPFLCTGTESHESARYRYQVKDLRYTASYPVNARGNPKKVGPGDSVTVRYVVENPATSIIEDQVSGMNLFIGVWIFSCGFLVGGTGVVYNLIRLRQLYLCRTGGTAIDGSIFSVEKSWRRGYKKVGYRFESPNSGRNITGKTHVPEALPFSRDTPVKVLYRSDSLFLLL